jgi:hypothetical protein
MKIYVTFTKSGGFQWGEHPGKLHPLTTPISTKSLDGVTFEFVSVGPTGIFYRLQNGASGRLRPSEGPSLDVGLGVKRMASFSTSSSGDYDEGHVEVLKFEKR